MNFAAFTHYTIFFFFAGWASVC